MGTNKNEVLAKMKLTYYERSVLVGELFKVAARLERQAERYKIKGLDAMAVRKQCEALEIMTIREKIKQEF